ncbi:glucuronyl esterase domain-containing protein [Dyadobacter chenhuakuii]|uniref:Prolyl oligopeptidase family serine peptidase n=1 Tax=Dyadobacter chenhuakuii TaxID=2909339 RepID=A0ABY4XK00_9BACT|nr:prolyl oligopeptidase family serine peptidase [Dyadobacter chenhuakuii]MCF2496514.1 prolyl oligopeptidase family serine peptidase [Dyadobacter chenhuakuii]USJ30571.1 prolyl oligopeptidase family serine peptidase [Dyadobacter chenhuakuii]
MKKLLTALLLLTCLTNSVAQNYDEAKVPAYTLPEVLKTAAGKEVTSKKMWEEVRRPEILRLFEDNIYGQMPKDYDSIRYTLKNEDKAALNGKARLKEVIVQVFRNKKSVQIHLVMFIPGNAAKPSPVFVLINNRGKDNTDPTRKVKSGFWPAEMVIDSGYAIAAFHVSDLAPDNKDTFMNGVLQLYPEQLEADNGMRAIGAWAWGASRVMDYFENDKDIDAKNVAVVGHSRGGKASLWAAAQDRRFAVCVTNCSGNTGAALARRQFGERIARINTTFPHWFNNNYKKFNNNENDLPVDQHMLIALIAPRPLYATNASKDLWADPTGTFLALKNAEKTYALYGRRSKLPVNPPAINVPLSQPPLAYHNREGEHDMTAYDWGNFIRLMKSRP